MDRKRGSEELTSIKTNGGHRLSIEDYDVIQTVGRGSYGEVVLAKDKATGEVCAIKILEKSYLAREKKQYQVFIEKEVLQCVKFEGMIRLLGSFHDQQYLYFVLDYCEGGEFSSYLTNNFKFIVKPTIQFYAAQIVHILDNLHSNGIVHRDLKPENLMMTKDNQLRVIDFGTCGFTKSISKVLFDKITAVRAKFPDEIDQLEAEESRNRSATFVGTAEYVSPELLEGESCTSSVDLWALGCIIYKMFVGTTPFVDPNDANEFKIFNKVKACQYVIPQNVPVDAADLISKLLVRNPRERLGWSEKKEDSHIIDIKEHMFFKGVNWATIMKQEAPKREVAHVLSAQDDDFEEFIQQSPVLSSTSQNTASVRPLLTGRVAKRVAWMIYKPRQLILIEDPPKLVYYDTETNEKKGEIQLNKQVVVELADKTKFTVLGAKKKYFFKELDHSANMWVEKIQKVIAKSD